MSRPDASEDVRMSGEADDQEVEVAIFGEFDDGLDRMLWDDAGRQPEVQRGCRGSRLWCHPVEKFPSLPSSPVPILPPRSRTPRR